jgi:hypothetical protein
LRITTQGAALKHILKKDNIFMSKVHLAVPHAPDRLLGHVRENGDVYRSDAGPDDKIGHVDLESGKIYSRRLGPDRKVGHVDLDKGKVYATKAGPDKYISRVEEDGAMHLNRSLAPDDYVGRMNPFISYAHAGAAMLLLVLPALEEQDKESHQGQSS